jgi:NAD(P)-dependent dehydrogenase (short-subunit alcohol dehydrogenase family)
MRDARCARTRLVFLTRRAVGAGAVDLASASVWGLVRSARAELPDRALGLLDVDEDPRSLAAIRAALARDAPELVVRLGVVMAPELVPAATDARASALAAEGTVLVTGGTGALGAAIARHLIVQHGAQRLLLVSRAGPSAPGADALAAELRNHGAEVSVRACDVGNRRALESLIASVPIEHPLSIVVHAAGVLDDGVTLSLSNERLDAVLAPKIDGAVFLHELVRGPSLRAFILFSSVAGAFGSPGQGSYAAANAFLDALACHRRALGLPATSIAWGPWAGAGMAARFVDVNGNRAARLGARALPHDLALALFDEALGATEAHVIASRFGREMLASRLAAAAAPELSPLGRKLAALAIDERRRAVQELVDGHVAATLGGRRDPASLDRSLSERGLDSLLALELRNRIAAATGLRLPPTLLFDHPTPRSLAERVVLEVARQMDADEEHSALHELERIESLLARLPAGDARATAIRARAASLASTPRREEAPDDLRGKTNDQLFALIDEEIREAEG